MSDPAATPRARLRAGDAGGTSAADGWRRDIASGTSRATMTAATKSSRTDVVTAPRPRRRGDDRRDVVRAPARRRDRRRGGHATTRHVGPVVVPRPDRRHDELPLRASRCGRHPSASPTLDGTVAGAVFVPVTGELFAAARGAGATRNGEPIQASSRDRRVTGTRRHGIRLPRRPPRRAGATPCDADRSTSVTSAGAARRRSISATPPREWSTPTSRTG